MRSISRCVWRISRAGGGLIETLEAFLSGLALETGAAASSTAGLVDFKREGRSFASAQGNVVEFRLDPEVADAVLGTPDTSASGRAAGWVRLAPATPKPNDFDRARAWFLSAFRYAGPTS